MLFKAWFSLALVCGCELGKLHEPKQYKFAKAKDVLLVIILLIISAKVNVLSDSAISMYEVITSAKKVMFLPEFVCL